MFRGRTFRVSLVSACLGSYNLLLTPCTQRCFIFQFAGLGIADFVYRFDTPQSHQSSCHLSNALTLSRKKIISRLLIFIETNGLALNGRIRLHSAYANFQSICSNCSNGQRISFPYEIRNSHEYGISRQSDDEWRHFIRITRLASLKRAHS